MWRQAFHVCQEVNLVLFVCKQGSGVCVQLAPPEAEVCQLSLRGLRETEKRLLDSKEAGGISSSPSNYTQRKWNMYCL